MMIPYFIVLFVLAIYGLHRYWLVYDYYAYAKNVPGPAAGSHSRGLASRSSCPFSTSATSSSGWSKPISRFDYPRELLDVQVLGRFHRRNAASRESAVSIALPRKACRSPTSIAPTARATKLARSKTG